MKNYNNFMEKFWLVAAIVSAAGVGYAFFFMELNEHPTVLVLPFMAFIMFLMRRWVRKRAEQAEQDARKKEGEDR